MSITLCLFYTHLNKWLGYLWINNVSLTKHLSNDIEPDSIVKLEKEEELNIIKHEYCGSLRNVAI